MSMKVVKRILLSGGGTGGHIYPALSVAQALKAQSPEVVIEFVGGSKGLEQKIISKEGHTLHLLKIKPLHKSVGRIQQFLGIIQWPFVCLQALWILLRFRPQVVMGFGGYASAPIVFVASLLRIRTALWEANVQPGMANKILSRWVNHCFVVFEESQSYFPPSKVRCLGYPLRQSIESSFSLQKERGSGSPCVLVFGGSQGAEVFNTIIPKICAQYPHIKFILQTGHKHFECVKNKTCENNLEILPFLDPIVNYYHKADVVVCRSGAGTVAELAALGQPCLFVPFPWAADNHQFKNAQALKQGEAAFLIEDKDFNTQSVSDFLDQFFSMSREEKDKMSQNMRLFFSPRASEQIAAMLLVKNPS